VPAWLELTSSGNTVTGSVSSDGATWSLVGSVTTPLSASATIGLAVTSHNTGVLNTSTFDNVSVTGGPPPPPLPAPWSGQDVGSTGLAGSASYASGQFTIAGAGADIWGTADAFQYVSQPTNGDAEIVARVTSLQNTDTEAKAGVMLRQSTDPGAADVILDIRPDGTIEFMSRSSSGQDATYLAGGATQPVPSWLELASSGNTVTGSVSSDGATWSVVGSVTTPLSASATIGLAVTSHNTAVLNTSTFDNVSVTGPPAAPNIVISASDAATRFGS
jgi:regulation of enolase protein 1 (concanavalin A-like superfamily)